MIKSGLQVLDNLDEVKKALQLGYIAVFRPKKPIDSLEKPFLSKHPPGGPF